MPPVYGRDLVQLRWTARVPGVFLLLLKHEERIREMLKKALTVDGLACFTYEVVRIAAALLASSRGAMPTRPLFFPSGSRMTASRRT